LSCWDLDLHSLLSRMIRKNSYKTGGGVSCCRLVGYTPASQEHETPEPVSHGLFLIIRDMNLSGPRSKQDKARASRGQSLFSPLSMWGGGIHLLVSGHKSIDSGRISGAPRTRAGTASSACGFTDQSVGHSSFLDRPCHIGCGGLVLLSNSRNAVQQLSCVQASLARSPDPSASASLSPPWSPRAACWSTGRPG
jgi:hypothetical protein